MRCNMTCDLHTHTTRSDGKFLPGEVVRKSIEARVGILAITDHNILAPDLQSLSREADGNITLLRGCEMSCTHTLSTGKKVELHVVILNYDDPAPALQQIAQRNRTLDREAYVGAILDALRRNGVEIGSYEFLRRKYYRTERIGRMTIAAEMVEHGFAADVDEAFDTYIGAHGKQLAYIPNPIQYAGLETVVKAALQDHGIPVLAHLFYYNTLDRKEQKELLRTFRSLAGPIGAMEVEYAKYSPRQREELHALAQEYGLLESAGSDYHGQNSSETLSHNFPGEIALNLLERQKAFYDAAKGGKV